MTRLHRHLNEAAGADPTSDLDLDALHERASTRRRHRQGRRAAGVVVLLVVMGITAAGVAGAWSGPDQQITAAEGGSPDDAVAPPEVVEPPTSGTEEQPSSEVPASSASSSEPEPSDPLQTTEVPSTPPSSETTASTTAPPGSRTIELRGTYEGTETYRLGDPACPDITHALEMELVTDDGSTWQGREDYCGGHVGLQWQSEGTFSLTAPDGSSLTGDFTSTAPMGTSGVPYTLEVTDGSGVYAGATGPCDVTISLRPLSFGSQAHSGTIACTLSVA